jgi:hypothetical protein
MAPGINASKQFHASSSSHRNAIPCMLRSALKGGRANVLREIRTPDRRVRTSGACDDVAGVQLKPHRAPLPFELVHHRNMQRKVGRHGTEAVHHHAGKVVMIWKSIPTNHACASSTRRLVCTCVARGCHAVHFRSQPAALYPAGKERNGRESVHVDLGGGM